MAIIHIICSECGEAEWDEELTSHYQLSDYAVCAKCRAEERAIEQDQDEKRTDR